MDNAEFDHPAPKGETREFTVAHPEKCEGCGGWEGYVVQLNAKRTHGRLYCSTPHLRTPDAAMQRSRQIADALECTSAEGLHVCPVGATIN